MTINCKGKLIDLSTPKIMGILNVTPDSFYDGGNYSSNSTILKQVEKMLVEGATFIDVGAYSSRPNAEPITEEVERKRLLPVINLLVKEFPNILISIDTFRSAIAAQAIGSGACMINDISAGNLDANMLPTIANLQVPYCMMHLVGTPQNMQQYTTYENLVQDIIYYFSERITEARKLGVIDIIIDPGFGFSKTTSQNFSLLKHLQLLQILELPLLVGVSRKSMIYKTLNSTANEALNGTSVLNTIALQKNAKILRVHDVKEAVECVTLYKELCNA